MVCLIASSWNNNLLAQESNSTLNLNILDDTEEEEIAKNIHTDQYLNKAINSNHRKPAQETKSEESYQFQKLIPE